MNISNYVAFGGKFAVAGDLFGMTSPAKDVPSAQGTTALLAVRARGRRGPGRQRGPPYGLDRGSACRERGG